LLEAFRHLIADEEVALSLLLVLDLGLRCFLLLRELQKSKPSTKQHCGAAQELADGPSEVVFDIGARLRVSDF
jgi:hypothetical protein